MVRLAVLTDVKRRRRRDVNSMEIHAGVDIVRRVNLGRFHINILYSP